MARKNSRVRRSNDRGRLARRQPGDPGVPKAPQQARIRVEDIVMPEGQCRFGTAKPKARFGTRAGADKALAQAQQQRARIGSTHVEKRVYHCPDGGCEGWHLTSREAFDESAWKVRREQYEQRRNG